MVLGRTGTRFRGKAIFQAVSFLKKDDAVQSELSITSFVIGADYDVSFGRDLIFGPNADLHLMKWVQKSRVRMGRRG